MAPKITVSVSILKRNLLYLNQQLAAALKNSSVVVKFVCVLNIFCYFLSFSETAIQVLSVTPGFIIPPSFWVWSAFTHCFLETRLYLLLADIITVGLCGKLLEPLWGAMEMLTFFALVNSSVAFLSVIFYILVFTITSNPSYLFRIQIHGLAGYCAAVSVAVKQIMPDHVLVSLPCGKLRNRNVPLCVLVLSLIFWPLGIVEGTYPVMFTSGLLSSWIYLRFFQSHSNGTMGDTADSFTFASFFPRVIQPPINVISNTIFELFVHVKICKKPIHKNSQSSLSVTLTIPGTDLHDAERRRQIALRALSERLSKVEPNPWCVPSDTTKSIDKSKGLHLTMPPVLSPNQSVSSPVTNSTQSESINVEMSGITIDHTSSMR